MISVILPTYNRCTVLKETVQTIISQSFGDWELIIWNDGSTDDTKAVGEELGKLDGRIKFVNSEQRQGTCVRFNLCANIAKGEQILFTADDMPMDKDYLKNLDEHFKCSNNSVLMGRVIEYGKEQNVKGTADDLVTVSKYTGNIVSKFHYDTGTDVEVPTAYGCMLMPKALFLELGGFRNYPHNGFREESDLSIRIRKRGYKLIYTPSAVIFHRHQDTGGQRASRKEYLRYCHKNHYLYLRRNYGAKILYMAPLYFLKCIIWEDILFPFYSQKIKKNIRTNRE